METCHLKMCVRCGVAKPRFDFYFDRRRGIFSSRCRECHGIRSHTCLVCGIAFIGKRGRKLCSTECKQRHRPHKVLTCQQCEKQFATDRLASRYCSVACARIAHATGRRCIRRTLTKARNAQSLLRYHVVAGHVVRPTQCEECGASDRPIEAAHYDYDQPLRVRWLCRSCHRRWDKHDPKGATYIAWRAERISDRSNAPVIAEALEEER